MTISHAELLRSGLSELIGSLAAARTGPDIAEALWVRRDEACGATAVALVLADPDARLVPRAGSEPGLRLDPLLVAEFACTPVPLFVESADQLLDLYPVLRTVGALPPGEACAVLPLDGAGTPSGALVVVWDRAHRFSAGDRGLLTALGRLCSAELARSRPADEEADVVERLRRRLRPSWLPHVIGAELAVRHGPRDATGAGVGFYDVFATDDGVWRLVAGEVTGGGVDAAVLAGLARQAFRTVAGDAGPAAVLGELDHLVRDFGEPVRRASAVCVDLTRRGRGVHPHRRPGRAPAAAGAARHRRGAQPGRPGRPARRVVDPGAGRARAGAAAG